MPHVLFFGWGFILGVFVTWVYMSYKHDMYRGEVEDEVRMLKEDFRLARETVDNYKPKKLTKSYFAYDELTSLPDVDKEKEDLPN